MATIKIRQTKSTIRKPFKQKRTMEALGLRRIGQTNTIEDSPQVRGMIDKVRHLIAIEEG